MSAVDFPTEGRDIVIQAGFQEWLAEQPALMEFEGDGFVAGVFAGAPDWGQPEDGFTLFWTDRALDECAEYYNDLGTTVARLAALIRGAERYQMFADGPTGFIRWSDNFFRQTLARS